MLDVHKEARIFDGCCGHEAARNYATASRLALSLRLSEKVITSGEVKASYASQVVDAWGNPAFGIIGPMRTQIYDSPLVVPLSNAPPL